MSLTGSDPLKPDSRGDPSPPFRDAAGLASRVHWVFLAAVLALFLRAILATPVAFGDQFEEIVRTYESSLGDILGYIVTRQSVFFRPLEYVWREALLFLFGERLISYNLFQIVLLALIGGLFCHACRVRRLPDAVAAMVGLACLFGYHGFHAALELNLAISNLVVVLGLVISVAILACPPTALTGPLAVIISAAALLTKEVGLVVPLVFLIGRIAGFEAVGTRTSRWILVLLAAYLAHRIIIVIGVGEIQDRAYGGEARDLGAYVVNTLATFSNILTAQPKSGDFAASIAGFKPRVWSVAQVLAPLVSFALIAYAALRGRIWSAEGDRELRRWVVLLAAVVVASSLLGFFYTADRHAATVAPILAFTLFLAVRRCLSSVRTPGPRVSSQIALVLLLTTCAASWNLRVAGGFYFLRGLGAAIQDDWVQQYDRFETRVDQENGKLYLIRFQSAALGMPVATIEQDRGIERLLFGGRGSIAR